MYNELEQVVNYCLKWAKKNQSNKLEAIRKYGDDNSLAALYDGERDAFLQVVGYIMQHHNVSVSPEKFAGTGDDPE